MDKSILRQHEEEETEMYIRKAKYNEGCGKKFTHKLWGERICGEFEDLKHSDHFIYCDKCSQNHGNTPKVGLLAENSGTEHGLEPIEVEE